ncbi:MAG: hypothetical protein M1830_003587 [Pleopsidium flavum]|nr:MAG: hypothetical protein M1830_003587 [Pleopsidium flavum]
MDTSAYLHRHGWRGSGHSLHPTGRGISRPLLVSHKQNVLGVGKKKHDAYADQWWARAFDSSLKGLDVNRDKEAPGVEVKIGTNGGALDMVRRGGGKWVGREGLYGFFVKGEGLNGTMTPEEGVVDAVEGQKRKREGEESREEKRRRKDRDQRETAESTAADQRIGRDIGDVEMLLKEERRKKKQSRKDARNATVKLTAVTGTTQEDLSSIPPRKKRRKAGANREDLATEPAPLVDCGFVSASILECTERAAGNGIEREAEEEEDRNMSEKLERRRQRAVRKALKAEQPRITTVEPREEVEEKTVDPKERKRGRSS